MEQSTSADAPRSPVPAAQRIELLDALRGFALFGILLANIHYFSGWSFLEADARAELAGAAVAQVEGFLFLLLIDGKFYTVFSLLFGIGFALQLQRLQRRTARALTVYLRRLFALWLIGMVHLCLIWDGDILVLYALTGLVLLLLRDVSDRQLLIGATVLILLPIVGWPLVRLLGLHPLFGVQGLADATWASLSHGADVPPAEWLARPDWASLWVWLQSGPVYRIAYLLDSWRLPKVLGVMMLGLWAGRRLGNGLLEDSRLLRRVALGGLALGLPANAIYAALGGLFHETMLPGIAAQAAYALGVVPLGLAYAALFALAWRRAGSPLQRLAPAGRMALSSYLGQSLICIALFYGVGLGLVGELGPLGFYAVALAIFAAQVVLSTLWLQRFEQGPLEALWRWMTYGGGAPAR
jgi:uncharacterized protein